MKSKTAFGLFIVGLLMCVGGVGGVEASLDNGALVQSFAIACVGLCIMYCGVTALNVSEYYDNH